MAQQRPGEKSSATSLNLRGLAEMMNGKTSAALATFDQALKVEPGFTQAKFNRGVALLKLGQHEAAASEFAPLASENGPLQPEAAYHRALALEAAGQREGALQSVRSALAVDPTLTDAIFLLGALEEKRGDLQAAGRAFKTYLQHHPESTQAMLHFGVLAQRSGRLETARRYLRQVIDLAPKSDEAVEAKKFLVMWD